MEKANEVSFDFFLLCDFGSVTRALAPFAIPCITVSQTYGDSPQREHSVVSYTYAKPGRGQA